MVSIWLSLLKRMKQVYFLLSDKNSNNPGRPSINATVQSDEYIILMLIIIWIRLYHEFSNSFLFENH